MKLFERLGTILTVALVGAALATSAAAKPHAQTGTIVDVAAGNKNFSTLLTLVKAGGLVTALSGDTKLTVFAPTNAAFVALEKEVPGVTKALTNPMNKALLVQVLKYHVLAGEVRSPAAIAAAKRNASVPTLLGKNASGKLGLSLKGSKLAVADSASIHVATVTKVDVGAANGVIHVVNKVLIPKSVAVALKKAGLI